MDWASRGRCGPESSGAPISSDGPASGAGTAARHAGRWPNAAGAVVLTYRFWKTALHSDPSVIGQDRPAGIVRTAHGDGGGGFGTIDPVSRRNGNHRQRRDQSTPSVGDDGDGPYPSHDRAVWPAGSRRDAGAGPRRTQGGGGGHGARTSRRLSRQGRLPHGCGVSARPDYLQGQDRALGAAGRVGSGVRDRVF